MLEKGLDIMENYRNQTIFVGCSGGIDSMVLVHFLIKNGFNIHVLHVNYQKREKESEGDMEFIRTFCKKNSIPFDCKIYNGNTTGNFQENARKFRYKFFESFLKEKDVIALAHHADDQIETFFMNTMRQSGIVGLACMPIVRGSYIRPFLHLSKADIFEYAVKHKIEWREDSSNQTSNYLRNKWRLEFLPEMEKECPELRSSVLTLIAVFQETQRELEQKIAPIAAIIEKTNRFDLSNELSSEELFELWRQLKQPSQFFQRFEELKTYSKGKFIETPRYKIFNEGNYLSFVDMTVELTIPEFNTCSVEELPAYFSKSEIYLNPEKIRGKLVIRKWEKGDKIAPVGVKGTQTVAQIIRDSKIPFSERATILVVHDDETIHWVVGLKVGKKAISQNGDDRILRLML